MQRVPLALLLAGAVMLASACELYTEPQPRPPATPAIGLEEETVEQLTVPGLDIAVACQGLPAVRCEEMAAEAAPAVHASRGLLKHLLLRCTEPPCTEARGAGEMIATHADGSLVNLGGWGWETPASGSGEPPEDFAGHGPPGDWELVCQGVPRALCEDFARSSYPQVNELGVELQAIVVRCTTGCSALEGEGETLVVLADGGRSVLSSWSYHMGGDELEVPPLP